jgi:GntR family carbon starvation induced transcriptional regulator
VQKLLPSVATFSDPAVAAPVDPKRNPTGAAAYWLERDIVRGVFQPFERLKITHLAEYFNVGVSPIRDAILLVSNGLIVHEHQKGYRVAPVSVADYEDVRLTYMRIYKLAIGLALELGTEEWEERILLQLHRSSKVRKVLPDGDPEARELWQRAYRDFHCVVLAGCGSALMLNIFVELLNRVERYTNLFGDLQVDRARDNHAEHREIVEALLARDCGRLDRVVTLFFENGSGLRDSVISRLSSKGPKTEGERSPAIELEQESLKPARRKAGEAR